MGEHISLTWTHWCTASPFIWTTFQTLAIFLKVFCHFLLQFESWTYPDFNHSLMHLSKSHLSSAVQKLNYILQGRKHVCFHLSNIDSLMLSPNWTKTLVTWLQVMIMWPQLLQCVIVEYDIRVCSRFFDMWRSLFWEKKL